MISFLYLFLALSPAFAQDEAAVPEVVEAAAAVEEAVEEAAPVADEAPEAAEGEEAPAEEAAAAPEVEVPATDEEAAEDVKAAISSLQNGQWGTFLVLFLGLLAFGWNRWTASKAASEDAPTEE